MLLLVFTRMEPLLSTIRTSNSINEETPPPKKDASIPLSVLKKTFY